ncbi:Hsp70 family protein [Solihabitans fulvus]|uniref:Hsp70 family protein n=1 Tax=Solihabitans fulvus TaxID=1892852 RepID=A0A5B2XGF1_9PSEU|nr:Hsp70 family protein [Solihabitans fulvus]KAA2261950.1 Hsp70 family protein [Solihabitans fulvus]
MPYVLGVDVGTSRASAAVSRRRGSTWGDVEDVRLGVGSATVPSVLHLAADGSALVGEDAERLSLAEPERIVRGFSRRVGDDVAAATGDTAQDLTAAFVRWIADRVAEREGGAADHVVVTHRAGWGGYRRGLLHEALRRVGLGGATLLPEPIAAAESLTVRDRVESGDTVASYRLGGGPFESSVVLRTESGAFELVASAESADDLGGAQFDDVVFERLRGEFGRAIDALDPADPQALLAAADLRDRCVEAKEALSTAPTATIPVHLPGLRADLTITRIEFEELIRPAVDTTVAQLLRTVRAAATRPRVVVLVGGSANIPLIAELVAARLSCRVAVEAAPEGTVARGAALAACRLARSAGGRAALPLPAEPTTVLPAVVEAEPPHLPELVRRPDDELDVPPPRPSFELTPLDLPEKRSLARLVPGVRPAALKAIGAVLVVAGVALTIFFQAGTSPKQSPAGTSGAGPAKPVLNTAPETPVADPSMLSSSIQPSSAQSSQTKDSGR